MTSGKPLSDQEQLYILKWAEKKSWGDIAKELNRDRWAVSRWYRDYVNSTKTIQVQIPKDIYEEIETEDKAIISYLFTKTISNYLLAKTV